MTTTYGEQEGSLVVVLPPAHAVGVDSIGTVGSHCDFLEKKELGTTLASCPSKRALGSGVAYTGQALEHAVRRRQYLAGKVSTRLAICVTIDSRARKVPKSREGSGIYRW